ncbi:MAG: methyltransferase domain-containing protein [Myxococcales bacterium]|nr:methyltransferase domain-containing protein [Myxococcales bacterium]
MSTRTKQRPLHRTIGPVPDLERHLPNDWWSSLFNALYLKTDGDVVESDRLTRGEVARIVEVTGLDTKARVLDLCCGQGRHVLELARRGFSRVTGLDRSRYLVRLARKRAQAEGLEVRIHEGDARRIPGGPGAFDAVCILGNSFGYFEREEDDAAVLRSVFRALKPGGQVVLDIVDGEWTRGHFEARSWEWIDQNHFVCRERSLAADRARLISREVVVHAEKGVLADQFYAERLYTLPEIQALLVRIGFEDVTFHGWIETESDRNQDLGMMARRMLLTGRSPARRVVVPEPEAQGEVTVLLGDPRLPDPIKLGGKFNPEDLEVVERLKVALADLEGFEFKYFDDHKGLVKLLEERKPRFVLNFCDEGFHNDAFRELHVPALLELYGVPYSGAGPVCLGMCYDKALVRALAESLDVPVPAETWFHPSDQSATLPTVFPALLKPNFGDSSVGITAASVVHDERQLMERLDAIRSELPGRPILIQEFLEGAEYSVALVGNPGQGLQALPVLAVDYSALPADLPQILGYESKWEPDSPYWKHLRYVEADLPDVERQRLVDHSARLFERLGCRDYARFDFRAGADGTIKLLEVNPNPGWCWDGKLNLMASMQGWSYTELLEAVLRAALERTGALAGKA